MQRSVAAAPAAPAVGVTRTRPRPWPWLVAAATLPVFALGNLLYPPDDALLGFTVMFSAIIGSFVLVGALLTSRVSGNPIGPIMLGCGALLASTVAIGTLSIVGAERGDLPAELLALGAILNDVGFFVPILVVMVGIPLTFPDGRLLSPRWRWVVVLVAFGIVALVLAQLLGPGPLGSAAVPNPFAVPVLFPLAEVLDALAQVSLIAFPLGLLAVVLRYRRGDEVQRHQLKWLIAVALVAAIAFPVAFLVPEGLVSQSSLVVGLSALVALPIAIAVAILRYRLYDIDRIISRTIAWAVITGLLVAAFAGLVIALQGLLTDVTQGQTLAVAVSTLVAAALFQPIRRHVQRMVDRRFDRARYDAQRTADAFAERLRDEIDLDSLAAALEGTVDAVMRPSAARVWLPPRDRAS